MDMAELLDNVRERGFTHSFICRDDALHCNDSGVSVGADDAWVVESQTVDQGTDPGDDATIYLIETRSGMRGFLIVGTSFHADPRDAAFLDKLIKKS